MAESRRLLGPATDAPAGPALAADSRPQPQPFAADSTSTQISPWSLSQLSLLLFPLLLSLLVLLLLPPSPLPPPPPLPPRPTVCIAFLFAFFALAFAFLFALCTFFTASAAASAAFSSSGPTGAVAARARTAPAARGTPGPDRSRAFTSAAAMEAARLRPTLPLRSACLAVTDGPKPPLTMLRLCRSRRCAVDARRVALRSTKSASLCAPGSVIGLLALKPLAAPALPPSICTCSSTSRASSWPRESPRFLASAPVRFSQTSAAPLTAWKVCTTSQIDFARPRSAAAGGLPTTTSAEFLRARAAVGFTLSILPRSDRIGAMSPALTWPVRMPLMSAVCSDAPRMPSPSSCSARARASVTPASLDTLRVFFLFFFLFDTPPLVLPRSERKVGPTFMCPRAMPASRSAFS